ncbi:MAG TPA: L-histidine N(alpha)-methyltransferase [Alphaproteobacteria bacterium]|jgi:dimethylhistidine N-methyltransferase
MDRLQRAHSLPSPPRISIRSLDPGASEPDGADVVRGLGARPKTLPPKYFYDAQGSRLFDRITALPEYYLTRTEQRILQDCARRLGALMGPADLVELGCGSARKTRTVVDALIEQTPAKAPLLYVPIDVSEVALEEGAAGLSAAFPRLAVSGLVGTYEAALADLPPRLAPRRLMMFLGSTIGNLDPGESAEFFAAVARALAPGDALLLGFDLAKTPGIIEAAYNDAQGVTAAFNLNMLRHLNRRFDGDFDLARFQHRAFFNAEASQIEMHLASAEAQTVRLRKLGIGARFEAGETIRTEISRKFRFADMAETVARHGFALAERWSDSAEWFALALFRRTEDRDRRAENRKK